MTENHYFCMGCGATIQTENHEEIGYTPTSVLTKMLEKEEPVYCQRCFRLRNYNELQPASLSVIFNCRRRCTSCLCCRFI